MLTKDMLPCMPVKVHAYVSFPKVSELSEMFENNELDFDIYLKTKSYNLQRAAVWDLSQKQNFIISILLRKPIPSIAANMLVETYKHEIIDGKQRILAVISFFRNEFPIVIDYKSYYYSDFDDHLKWSISSFTFQCNYHYERETIPESKLSDDDKIKWFLYINDTAVQQNMAHILNLRKLSHTEF